MACARLAATPATLIMRPPRKSAVPSRPRAAEVRRNCRGGVPSGGGAQFADMQAAPSADAKQVAPAACRGRSLRRPLGESSVTPGRNWFGRRRSALGRFGKEMQPRSTAAIGNQVTPAAAPLMPPKRRWRRRLLLEPVFDPRVARASVGRLPVAPRERIARIRRRRRRRMLRSGGQLVEKALRAPADSCVLKIDPLSGAGGKGITAGTDSSRGARQGLPVMVRSLRSSQNFRWPRA